MTPRNCSKGEIPTRGIFSTPGGGRGPKFKRTLGNTHMQIFVSLAFSVLRFCPWKLLWQTNKRTNKWTNEQTEGLTDTTISICFSASWQKHNNVYITLCVKRSNPAINESRSTLCVEMFSDMLGMFCFVSKWNVQNISHNVSTCQSTWPNPVRFLLYCGMDGQKGRQMNVQMDCYRWMNGLLMDGAQSRGHKMISNMNGDLYFLKILQVATNVGLCGKFLGHTWLKQLKL